MTPEDRADLRRLNQRMTDILMAHPLSAHVTRSLPTTPGRYAWRCSCGAQSRRLFTSQYAAVKASDGHRARAA